MYALYVIARGWVFCTRADLLANTSALSSVPNDTPSALFQIHELLQHYEESKPAPILDSSAALVNEVSLDTINFAFFFFFHEAQVGGNAVLIKIV